MTAPRPAIIFDLDGTLVDTAPDLAAALNAALASLGRPEVAPDRVRHLVGHGARALLNNGLAMSGEAPAALVELGLPVFMAHYRAHIADGSKPYPGVEAALDRVAAAGFGLAICTNKPVALARALITALGWDGRFAAIIGGDSEAAAKPDPRPVLAAMHAAGGNSGSSIFLGDSSVDVAAARAAGVPVIVVSFGFSDRPAAELGADRVIDHWDSLDAALASLTDPETAGG